jgi:RHS repeat-associated protein
MCPPARRSVERIDYDAWGSVTGRAGRRPVSLGYAGGLEDPATGLIRFGARDYDPSVGRWTCKDPVGLATGTNVYEYCGGEPVSRADPSGLIPGREYGGLGPLPWTV